jgi:hypothetical protein
MAKQKMKFKAGKAKSTKKIKENSKKGANYGNMLWVAADTSKTVRMLVEPKDWEEYQFVVVEKTDDGKNLGFKGKLPLFDGVEDTVPEAGRMNGRVAYAIPVVVIEDGKPQDRVMYWEPGKKMLNELLTIFEKRKTLTDRDVEIIREGSGRDTTYTLYWDDPKKRSKVLAMLSDAPDFADELVTMVNDFMGLYDADGDGEDDEDERPSKKSKSKKSKAAKKRQMEDDEDDDEDDDDDTSEEDDDDDESDDDDDDADGDDDEDDEDGDDEDDEIDLDAMDFDELKALAKKLGVEVKKGTKTSGYKKALAAHLEAQGEDDDEADDDDDEDEGDDLGSKVTGTFTVTDIDADAFTVDLEDAEGNTLETVYLDRSRDDIDEIAEGSKYTATVEKDEDDDWTLVTPLKAAGKAKKSKSKKK